MLWRNKLRILFVILTCLFQLSLEYGIESCPKIYTGTPYRGFSAFIPHFASKTIEALERCCSSNIQCDVRKRSAINGISIDKKLRHCECEHEFYQCVYKANILGVSEIADYYFRKTQKCYAFDHPIIKCERFKCFYQPKKIYEQYPSEAEAGTVRCAEYKLDKSMPKKYQTFDLMFTYEAYGALDYQTLEDNASACGGENSDIEIMIILIVFLKYFNHIIM